MRTRLASALAATTLTILPALSATDAAAFAAPAVRFSAVQYDSPGNDTGSNRSVNAEWIKVTNRSSQARTLTGWTIRDTANHVYRFGTFKLGAGNSVRLHTGKGSNTRTDRYWGEGYYVWNNTGDKAILRNSQGTTVDTCSWGDGNGNTSC